MCRIFFASNPSLIPLEMLKTTFENLNDDAGGDGVGIGFYSGGVPVIYKGHKVTPEKAARIVSEMKHPVLVHFRKASAGTEVKDFLCHPFEVKEGIFCQNGGVPEFSKISSSDTVVLREMINKQGFTKVAHSLSGYGVLALLKPNGELEWHHSRVPKEDKEKQTVRPFKEIRVSDLPPAERMAIRKHNNREDDNLNLIIGISRPECMRLQRPEKPEGDETECFDIEAYEDVRIVCSMNAAKFEEIFDVEAPWSGDELVAVGVPVEVMWEYPELKPVGFQHQTKADKKVVKETTKVGA